VAPGKCPIEVIDSRLITSPLALVAKGAAKVAASGSSMQETLDHIQRLIPAMRSYGILDTLKYIIKGGRLGRAGAAVGSLLPVRPVLTIKGGGVSMVGVARTRSKAIERLVDLFRPVRNVEEVAIAHSAADEEISSFVGKLREFLPDIKPMIGKLGPAIGTHGGPGTILVAMQQKLGQTDADLEAEEKRPGQLPSMHSLRESIRHRMQKDTSPFCTGRLISA
jgi:DegV family protein with EDD domain